MDCMESCLWLMVNKANLNTAAAPGIKLMRQDCIITISTTTKPTQPPRH